MNGYSTGTGQTQSFSEIAFAFRITPQIAATGIAFAVVMGVGRAGCCPRCARPGCRSRPRCGSPRLLRHRDRGLRGPAAASRARRGWPAWSPSRRRRGREARPAAFGHRKNAAAPSDGEHDGAAEHDPPLRRAVDAARGEGGRRWRWRHGTLPPPRARRAAARRRARGGCSPAWPDARAGAARGRSRWSWPGPRGTWPPSRGRSPRPRPPRRAPSSRASSRGSGSWSRPAPSARPPPPSWRAASARSTRRRARPRRAAGR